MIVVRNCFTAKPGQAGKLAQMFKEAAAAGKMPHHRVLTDVTGEFNRVILEFQVPDLAAFEAQYHEYTTNPVFREKLAGYTDLWITGTRELLRVA